jgi:hypothetical protein
MRNCESGQQPGNLLHWTNPGRNSESGADTRLTSWIVAVLDLESHGGTELEGQFPAEMTTSGGILRQLPE